MNKVRKLPGAAKRYVVEEPLMMLSIGEFEQMIQHMTKMNTLHLYPDKEASVIKQQHQLYLKKCRAHLQAAKAHYQIKN